MKYILNILCFDFQPAKYSGVKTVNFKEELEGPVVVPDQDLPDKMNNKQDKGSKKFFFFKKKKTKVSWYKFWSDIQYLKTAGVGIVVFGLV